MQQMKTLNDELKKTVSYRAPKPEPNELALHYQIVADALVEVSKSSAVKELINELTTSKESVSAKITKLDSRLQPICSALVIDQLERILKERMSEWPSDPSILFKDMNSDNDLAKFAAMTYTRLHEILSWKISKGWYESPKTAKDVRKTVNSKVEEIVDE